MPQSLKGSEKPPRQVKIGDQECPRCGKTFTLSYWTCDTMIQARCLSCDLTWPRPDVV
jgi:Zn ribbon nucleic-acid-binding protein